MSSVTFINDPLEMFVTSLFRAQCSALILRSVGTSGLEPLAGCPPQSQSRAWPEGRSADVEVGIKTWA